VRLERPERPASLLPRLPWRTILGRKLSVLIYRLTPPRLLQPLPERLPYRLARLLLLKRLETQRPRLRLRLLLRP
jgi:hypothetical protein